MAKLTKKNLIVNKEYTSIGTFNDTWISVFKYEDKLVVVVTNPNTKTASKKEKEDVKEYNLSKVELKSKEIGSHKVVTAEGETKVVYKYENTVTYNGKTLFEIITVGSELTL